MASVPFTLLTAFSSSINGGNPAAVVFIDLNVPTSTFAGIARNLNQPMTSFLSKTPLPSKDEKVAAFGIRWYTPSGHEPPLCGHASLAAAQAVFERPDLVSGTVEAIELHTLTHGIVTARKVEGGLIEIRLPAGEVEEVVGEEKVKISEIVTKAFGRTVSINYVGKGTKGFDHCKTRKCAADRVKLIRLSLGLLVELDEKEKLGMCDVDAAALVSLFG
jgi:PhzF family phenazine biosynthesis protein